MHLRIYILMSNNTFCVHFENKWCHTFHAVQKPAFLAIDVRNIYISIYKSLPHSFYCWTSNICAMYNSDSPALCNFIKHYSICMSVSSW